MKTHKIVMAVLIALMGLFILTGCNSKNSASSESYDFEAEINGLEKTYFVDSSKYSEFVKDLPKEPDFKSDSKNALAVYKNAATIENLTSGRLYIGNNYLLVDSYGAIRVINPDTSSNKLVDVKLFKNDADKLVLIGTKAIDDCRVPVALTIMEDGTILKETVFDNVKSIDTIGISGTVLLKAQQMTLVQTSDNNIVFYRFGEEISEKYQMPDKKSGAYSSVFLAKDNTLYITLVNPTLLNPWIRIAKVDSEVKELTDKVFDLKEGYSFPIYTKSVNGESVKFTALMDMNTYNSYVYTMYPSIGDTAEPNTKFEIIQPKDYVPSETETNESQSTEDVENL